MEYPGANADERELLLSWLGFLRESLLSKLDGLSEEQARWTPEGGLLPLLGIVNHCTNVEWRWIDGAWRGADVGRTDDELHPGPELTVPAAVAAYRERGRATDEAVRSATSLTEPCTHPRAVAMGIDLRWALVHLVEETARHAGHADATRELLDGTTGI